MQITVKTSTCDIILEVEPSNTVEHIKDNIQVKTGIHRRFQKLFFSNKRLEDGCVLSDYQLENSSCIDFQLIVPSFDEVLDAMFTLNAHIDSHTACTNDITSSSSDKVTEAMITLKAFVDSHSCCAIAITEILKASELTADRNSKIKLFCEKLLHENRELINVRDELCREIKALKVSMQNMQTEVANTKAEVADQTVLNQPLFEKVEVLTKLSVKMEQRIEELSAEFCNIRAKEINE